MEIVESITDLNGITHINCPRCKNGIWRGNGDSVKCQGNIPITYCDMYGFNRLVDGERYQLQLVMPPSNSNISWYVINWYKDYCMVRLVMNGDWAGESTRLPLLSYDITEEKLAIYLTFS
jgi:hypothetical protein